MPIHRTRVEHAALDRRGWAPLEPGWLVVVLPPEDTNPDLPRLSNGERLRARMTARDQNTFARSLGAELIHDPQVEILDSIGFQLVPELRTPGPTMRDVATSVSHDEACWRQIERRSWDGLTPVAGFGKPFTSDGGIEGWDKDGPGPGTSQWQPHSMAHDGPAPGPDGEHNDYSSCAAFVKRDDGSVAPTDRPPAPPPVSPPVGFSLARTLRQGMRGPDIAVVQSLLRLDADGIFGPKTHQAVRDLQKASGLVSDGVVGQRTAAVLGLAWKPAVRPEAGKFAEAPACRQALRDATARWPNRRRTSDGILGDEAHQARKSDHNDGNAVDISHDPGVGCDADVLAEIATSDQRVSYVIWNRRIFSRVGPFAGQGWRPYKGSNPHTIHVHISIIPEMRLDDRHWGWWSP